MFNWQHFKYGLQIYWKIIRQWINNNPKIAVKATIFSLSLFFLILIIKLIPHHSPNESMGHQAWYYDLNTKKLFSANGDKTPPIKAPSGALSDGQPAGVRAYVYSYSLEPNESQQFIGYLEKFTPEGRKYISACREAGTKASQAMIQELNRNRYVSSPNDVNWFLASSEEGKKILKHVSSMNAKGQRPVLCMPNED